MGLMEKLLGKTVFLDTAPIIYYIEGKQPIYESVLKSIFIENSKGNILFATSALTLLELLVQPLRVKRFDLVEKYTSILTTSSNLKIMDLDPETSLIAANLRADYNLKTPDAIQIASSIISGSDLFLTNDKQLSIVEEIEVLVLADETTMS